MQTQIRFYSFRAFFSCSLHHMDERLDHKVKQIMIRDNIYNNTKYNVEILLQSITVPRLSFFKEGRNSYSTSTKKTM